MLGWRRFFRSRRVWYAAAGVVAVAMVGALVWWWLTPDETTQPYRGREFRDVTVCLLTDNTGVSSPQAAPVWAGLHDASLRAMVRVQAHEIGGAQQPTDADSSVHTLVLRHCRMIFTVGDLAGAAAQRAAATFPGTRFVIAGPGVTSANVAVVDPTTADVQTQVAQLVTAALGSPS